MTPLLPPGDLASRTPEITRVTAGSSLHRFYTKAHEPLYYDTSRSGRLNAPDASYGVLYAARDPYGAFAETFLRRPGRTMLDPDLLAAKSYVRMQTAIDLVLVKLAGPGLAILGATAEVVHSGLPYDAPQAWSKAIAGAYAAVDGIAYHARHDDEELCYALFDRCRPSLFEVERRLDLDDDWFWRLALRYRVGLPPS